MFSPVPYFNAATYSSPPKVDQCCTFHKSRKYSKFDMSCHSNPCHVSQSRYWIAIPNKSFDTISSLPLVNYTNRQNNMNASIRVCLCICGSNQEKQKFAALSTSATFWLCFALISMNFNIGLPSNILTYIARNITTEVYVSRELQSVLYVLTC